MDLAKLGLGVIGKTNNKNKRKGRNCYDYAYYKNWAVKLA